MSLPGEGLASPQDPIQVFETYREHQSERLVRLQALLEVALSRISDYDSCNQLFKEIGRSDLVVHDTAEMMRVDHPEEVPARCDNFTPKFMFYTGFVEDMERGYILRTPVAINELELLGLIDGNFSFDEGSHPGHANKPAFARMHILFTSFTNQLVLGMSAPEARDYRFLPELFVAYQLMSRLVDKNDEYVMKDGVVNKGYLCV